MALFLCFIHDFLIFSPLFQGVVGCSISFTLELALAGFGDQLEYTARHSTPAELDEFLIVLRNDMIKELLIHSANRLPSLNASLAARIHKFPDMGALFLYLNPVTSFSLGGSVPDAQLWQPAVPDIARLATLCERSFSWGAPPKIYSMFERTLWRGTFIQRLLDVCSFVFFHFILDISLCHSLLMRRSDLGCLTFVASLTRQVGTMTLRRSIASKLTRVR